MIETNLDKDEFWANVLNSLESQTKSPQFNSRYGRIIPVSLTDSTITLAAPNHFSRDWFLKGIEIVQNTIYTIAGHALDIEVVVDENIISI